MMAHFSSFQTPNFVHHASKDPRPLDRKNDGASHSLPRIVFTSCRLSQGLGRVEEKLRHFPGCPSHILSFHAYVTRLRSPSAPSASVEIGDAAFRRNMVGGLGGDKVDRLKWQASCCHGTSGLESQWSQVGGNDL